EHRSRGDCHWMQQQTDPAGLFRGSAMPLALLAQPTGATLADASGIEHAQAPISFPAPFLRKEARASRTAQRAVRVGSKVLTREAARFPGQCALGRAIATGWSRSARRFLFRRRLGGGSKLSGAQRLWLQ